MRDDEGEIEDLVLRFSAAAGNVDYVQWASTWALDGHWSLGDGREYSGRDRLVREWIAALATYQQVTETCLHGNCDIDPEPGIGRGRWYVQRAYLGHDGDRSILLAHYDDSYVFEANAWKFASRRLVRLYHGPGVDGGAIDTTPV